MYSCPETMQVIHSPRKTGTIEDGPDFSSKWDLGCCSLQDSSLLEKQYNRHMKRKGTF